MAISQETIPPYRQVGALFDERDNAEKAAEELAKAGFARRNIVISTQHHLKDDPEARRKALSDDGYVEEDVLYFDKELVAGRTLVSVSNVPESQCGTVIRILNENGSHYDPDGTRNMRDDVVGMTTGAAVGAALGGMLGGPIGFAMGEVGGAAVGGALGILKEESE